MYVDRMHRDLKPQNVLIKGVAEAPCDWEAHISDFGESREIDPDADVTMTQVGTPLYIAPARQNRTHRRGAFCARANESDSPRGAHRRSARAISITKRVPTVSRLG